MSVVNEHSGGKMKINRFESLQRLYGYCTAGVGGHSGSTRQDDVTPQMTTALTSEAEPPTTLEERLLLMSKEQLLQAEHILLVIRYIIFAIALPTTICNIVVFAQREMRGATSVYVIGLSVAQLLYIVTNVVGRVMHTSVEKPFNSYTYIIYRSVSVGSCPCRRSCVVASSFCLSVFFPH